MWFRIELNKDRSVKSCVEVEGSLNEGRSVHYVEANSKAEAIKMLADRYDRSLAKKREYSRAYNEKMREKGICSRCKKKNNKPGNIICSTCQRKQAKRALAVTHGAPLMRAQVPAAKTPEQKAERMIIEKERNAKSVESWRQRGGIYWSILKKYDELSSKDFRAWLVARCKFPAETKPQAAE